jgi:hypothetical protein
MSSIFVVWLQRSNHAPSQAPAIGTLCRKVAGESTPVGAEAPDDQPAATVRFSSAKCLLSVGPVGLEPTTRGLKVLYMHDADLQQPAVHLTDLRI